jgi:hypothetical protein
VYHVTDEIDIWCVVLPMNDEQMIAELIEALNNRDLLVQPHASETLGSMGFLAIEPVISVLAEFATWEDFENFAKKHSFAEEALVKIGKPAVGVYSRCLTVTVGAYASVQYTVCRK